MPRWIMNMFKCSTLSGPPEYAHKSSNMCYTCNQMITMHCLTNADYAAEDAINTELKMKEKISKHSTPAVMTSDPDSNNTTGGPFKSVNSRWCKVGYPALL